MLDNEGRFTINLHRIHDLPPPKIVLIRTSQFTMQSCKSPFHLLVSHPFYYITSSSLCFQRLNAHTLIYSIYNAKF